MINETNFQLDPLSGDTILFRSCLSSHVNQFVFSFLYLGQMRKGEVFYHLSGIPPGAAVIIYGLWCVETAKPRKIEFSYVMNPWNLGFRIFLCKTKILTKNLSAHSIISPPTNWPAVCCNLQASVFFISCD